jgi:IS5 family transposase
LDVEHEEMVSLTTFFVKADSGAKAGSKHHLLVDTKGQPLAESLTGANVHDTHELFPCWTPCPM